MLNRRTFVTGVTSAILSIVAVPAIAGNRFTSKDYKVSHDPKCRAYDITRSDGLYIGWIDYNHLAILKDRSPDNLLRAASLGMTDKNRATWAALRPLQTAETMTLQQLALL